MQLRDDHVAVRVPATSANLGPGFDSMGLALDLWDEIEVRATAGATHVHGEGEGAGSVPEGEDHLVVQSLRMALDRMGAPQVGIDMRCHNRIPHSRGLGSSASAIVAGLALAHALVGDSEAMTKWDMLHLATEAEGHPDNVAPAVLGGATVAWVDPETGAGAVKLEVPEVISPVAFVPDFELPTSSARAVLPAQVPHVDASFNAGRAALLAALLAGGGHNCLYSQGDQADMVQLLMAATQDRLHQEQRRSSMEPSLALVDWLRRAGVPAVVSGAGPTVLSLTSVFPAIQDEARAAGWKVRPLSVPNCGVTVTKGKMANV